LFDDKEDFDNQVEDFKRIGLQIIAEKRNKRSMKKPILQRVETGNSNRRGA
jgi:hypothetical protein